ncbi:MAG TPA: glutamate synthase (NADPH), homotetrameric [Actinobacteria bacterium]|nr:glutamate synthase (NADPH), homotetrameric [Actinomycetota bacterium]
MSLKSESNKKRIKKEKISRTPIPEQDPKVRAKNFKEVTTGYSEEDALREASRCIQCKDPRCIRGCPVEIDIKGFIKLITEKKFEEALAKIRERNTLPAVCGRVCPQEDQCEKVCILGIKGEPVAIGRLERYVADRELKRLADLDKECVYSEVTHKCTREKVAIIGAGPAGLTCAAELAKKGYRATIFEALHKAGGVLVYGIPEFRLPKDIVQKEIDYLRSMDVELKVNMVMGKILTIDELFEDGFKAVFIATGAGLPYFMDIPGENLNGVYSANEYLTRSNLMKAYKFPESDTPIMKGEKVAVIGGGNVAMDSARTALRLGAKHVYLIYRRSEAEMPARNEEIEHAKEEGIDLKILNNPVEIIGKDGWVDRIKVIKMKLGEPDESGRRRPIPIKGSEYDINVDVVVIAIGQGPNPLLASTMPELKLNSRGNIAADPETGETSIKGVFAGGDIVTGAATVILAMGAGRKAAHSMDEYIRTGE